MIDLLDVTLAVTAALEDQDIPYTIGGSMASSLAGEPRSSIDADILVDMQLDQIEAFVTRIGPDFYADAGAVRRALTHQSTVNLIHVASGFKVDLFFLGSPLEVQQLARRREVRIASKPDRVVFVHSPEDILLQKLFWYRRGGEMSDRQWRDVLGIILVQGERLDQAYLEKMAAIALLTDLLGKAMDAGRRG